jgi:murein hydrolase activator
MTKIMPEIVSIHRLPRSQPVIRPLLLAILLLNASFWLFSATNSYAGDKSNAQLKTIRQDIAEKEKQVNAGKEQRNELINKLKSQEKAIAKTSRQLRSTQQELEKISQDITQLNASVNKLEQQKTQQESLLASQLDAAFRLGKHTGIEVLFNSKNVERNDRILTYFGYLNAERQKTIRSLKTTKQSLAEKKVRLVARQQQQQQILGRQTSQQTQLQQARAARKQTLTTLESSLKQDQADLAQLRENESQLQSKIARAEQQARARVAKEAREAERIKKRQQVAKNTGKSYQPSRSEEDLIARTGGLGRPVGQYAWPIKGALLHNFGEIIQGELRYKGLVISAKEGSEVHAIAAGRVLMADWLQGYGLVVVLEHGKGDMTLYGYNQSALVNVGDQVEAGQAIALAGNSGGQGVSSLYFEIRRQGQAVNPLSWLLK